MSYVGDCSWHGMHFMRAQFAAQWHGGHLPPHGLGAGGLGRSVRRDPPTFRENSTETALSRLCLNASAQKSSIVHNPQLVNTGLEALLVYE